MAHNQELFVSNDTRSVSGATIQNKIKNSLFGKGRLANIFRLDGFIYSQFDAWRRACA